MDLANWPSENWIIVGLIFATCISLIVAIVFPYFTDLKRPDEDCGCDEELTEWKDEDIPRGWR